MNANRPPIDLSHTSGVRVNPEPVNSKTLRFDNRQELFDYVIKKNPALKNNSLEEVTNAYLARYQKIDNIQITEENPVYDKNELPKIKATASRTTGAEPNNPGQGRQNYLSNIGTALKRTGEYIQLPDPIHALANGLGWAEQNAMDFVNSDAAQNLSRGITSGSSLGASELITPGPIPKDSMAYNTGEFLGGIVPYAKAYGLLAPRISAFFSARLKSKQLETVLAGVASSGASTFPVDTVKQTIRGEDVEEALSQGATASFIDMATDAAVRLVFRGFGKGAEKLFHPENGAIDQKVLDFLVQNDVTVMPSHVLPHSSLAAYMETRLTHTAANRDLLSAARTKLVNAIEDFRGRFSASLGPNPATWSASDAGKAVNLAVDDTVVLLKEAEGKLYNGLLKTGVGNMPIDPFQVVNHQALTDVLRKGALFPVLEELIGKRVIQRKRLGALSSTDKRLRKFYKDLRDEQVGPEGEIIEHNYQWWWDELQEIGAMLGEQKIIKDAKAHRKVKNIYHWMKDSIDAQASAQHPQYAQAIAIAREQSRIKFAFMDNQHFIKIKRWHDNDEAEKIIPGLFKSEQQIDAVKKLLGPVGFNRLRQSWLVDILAGVTNRHKDMLEFEYIDAKKLFAKLDQLPGYGAMDSKVMKSIFSDEGFVDLLTGKPIKANTDAVRKYEDFTNFVNIVKSLDTAKNNLRARSEMLSGQNEERLNFSTHLKGLFKDGGASVRRLVGNMMLMRRGTELYMEPVEKNIFLGAKVGPWQGGVGGFRTTLPDGSISSELKNLYVPPSTLHGIRASARSSIND